LSSPILAREKPGVGAERVNAVLAALVESALDDRFDATETIKEHCDVDRITRHFLSPYIQGLPEELSSKIETSYRAFLLRSLQTRLGALGARSWTNLGSRGWGDGYTLVFTRTRDGHDNQHELVWYIDPASKIVDVAYDGVRATELQKRELDRLLEHLAGDVASLPNALDRLAR
jgi:ABC-type transporter MlaC component